MKYLFQQLIFLRTRDTSSRVYNVTSSKVRQKAYRELSESAFVERGLPIFHWGMGIPPIYIAFRELLKEIK